MSLSLYTAIFSETICLFSNVYFHNPSFMKKNFLKKLSQREYFCAFILSQKREINFFFFFESLSLYTAIFFETICLFNNVYFHNPSFMKKNFLKKLS